MHLLNCLLWTLTTISIATGQDDGQPSLSIKPLGDKHTRAEDASMMFTCQVDGAEEDVNYQLSWTNSEGTEVVDTSGSSRVYVEEDGNAMKKMYITKVVEKDAGTYTCSATIGGNRVTKTTQLDLFKEITFENVPQQQYPIIHTDALITCVVTGNPPPAITWRKGSKSLKTDAAGNSATIRYKLEPGKGLIIKNISEEDNGAYICRAEVTADGRYGFRTITVDVHIPPAITRSTGRVEDVEGQHAVLSCDATGKPKPKFEFLKTQNGVLQKVDPNDRIVIDSEAGSLKFVTLSKSDEGEYTCRASNDAGNATAVSHVHVFVKPKIFEVQNATETENERATLICRSDGDPVPAMSFRKAGEDTDLADDEDDRITVKQNGNVLTLTISSLTPTDSAAYTCRAVNKYGDDQSVGKITVEYQPKMVEGQPSQVYTWTGRHEGSNISCHADGEPLPKYTWTSKSRPLQNNDTFHVFNEGGVSKLQVKVREADQSWIYTEYSCTASNKQGSAEYKFELKRASTPSSPLNVIVDKISPTSADLIVAAPEEDGGLPVQEYVVEYGETSLSSQSGRPVLLKNLQPNTNYSVQVKAKNEVGLGDPFVLDIATEPARRPFPVKISSGIQGSRPEEYLIKWEIPNTGGSPITLYKITYRKIADDKTATDETTTFVHTNENNPQVEKLLTALKARHSYKVEILAQNAMGWSDANEEFVFTTSEDPFATVIPETTTSVEKLPDEPPVSGKSTNGVDAAAAASVPLGLVVAVVLVLMLVTLIVIDVACNFANHCGVTHQLCLKFRGGKKSRDVTVEKGESEHMVKKQPIQTAVKEMETEPAREQLHDSLVNADETTSDSNPSTARKVDDSEQPATANS